MPDISANFEDVLIQSLKGNENLQRSDIEDLAKRLAPVYEVQEEDLDTHIKNIETKLLTTMDEGVALVDPDAEHNDRWPDERPDGDWKYWKDYEQILSPRGPRVAHTLGDVTKKILGLLQDPKEPPDWDRRGLVIGHVQSGKTGNYIGLISKAADAGYKFIIVIAGIQNNLRKQTQHRIDEGFVGRDSTPNLRKTPVGVGKINRNREYPISLTNTDNDFTKQMADSVISDLKAFRSPVVVVIKKNVTTLANLYRWLRELNARNSTDKIGDIPMLMIDDEADHASIDTTKPDQDPTRTNSEIRRILSLFRKSCYVGYTATPFANIFINPDSQNEMLEDDLFPRDFIYCLDAPSSYFGPSKIFLDEEPSKRILRTIDDAESYLPLAHKKYYEVQDLPPSLKQAINVFVIGKTIRILRTKTNVSAHCSMMINASRFVDIQRQIKEHVSYYLENMTQAVRLYYALPENKALTNEHMANLKKTYDDEFANVGESWVDIQKNLFKAIDSIKTYVINNKSEDSLDYKRFEEKNESLTVIAVGGLSLSRGLTLEGLMVSYMYRNTKMYDTLMQMGRWFGYRNEFEDLCRVWLSDESQGWYSHIAEATEELRQQIKQMQRDRMTPKDFGLYVRTHPDSLVVTALGKMRGAERRTLSINLSGKLVESTVVPSAEEVTVENLQKTVDLFGKLSARYPSNGQPVDGSYFYKDVNLKDIEEFLIDFRFHKQIRAKKDIALEYLRKISDKYPCGDVAFVSLKKPKSDNSLVLGREWKMFCQTRSVGMITGIDGISKVREPSVNESGFHITSKDHIASRGAEDVGLTMDQKKRAKAEAGNPSNVADHFYRTVRRKPLLMIHLLTLRKGESEILLDQVPAIGISFPDGDYSKSVECVVNQTWVQQWTQMEMFSSEEEDDYDN